MSSYFSRSLRSSRRIVRREVSFWQKSASYYFPPRTPFVRSSSSRYLSTPDGSSTSKAFDRQHKRKQRDNTARATKAWRETTTTSSIDDNGDILRYDYIREEVATRLVDRLDDMKRAFPLALDLGSGPGYIHRAICADDAIVGFDEEEESEGESNPMGGIGGVRKLVQMDSSHGMLYRDEDVSFEGSYRCDTYRLAVEDEEDRLPFPDGTFDLVISSCSLHWINGLPQVFGEVHRVLKPDGCFLLAMLGGTETLPELRASMVLGELEREGGVSPHVGPFVQAGDIGSLMQRAGFALPTVDVDSHTVTYPNAAVLMEHLQRMGENNAALKRRDRVSRETFLATCCIYDQLFPAQTGNQEIEASLQVIYAIGWTPHESQQRPLERGTAKHKVGEMIEFTEADDDGTKSPSK